MLLIIELDLTSWAQGNTSSLAMPCISAFYSTLFILDLPGIINYTRTATAEKPNTATTFVFHLLLTSYTHAHVFLVI